MRRSARPCASIESKNTRYAASVSLRADECMRRNECPAHVLVKCDGKHGVLTERAPHRERVELQQVRKLVRRDAALLRPHGLLYAGLHVVSVSHSLSFTGAH
jgi:hypothetical protein